MLIGKEKKIPVLKEKKKTSSLPFRSSQFNWKYRNKSVMLQIRAKCYSSPGMRLINCLRMLSFEQSPTKRIKNFPGSGDRGTTKDRHYSVCHIWKTW